MLNQDQKLPVDSWSQRFDSLFARAHFCMTASYIPQTRIVLRTDNLTFLESWQEELGPCFDCQGDKAAEIHIAGLQLSSEEWADLRNALCRNTELPYVSLHFAHLEPDRKFLVGRRLSTSSVDFIETPNVILGINHPLRQLLVLSSTASSLQYYTLDVFAHCLERLAEHSGALLLHGGAVELPSGECVIICGPKGSGKTTVLTTLLKMGATYLANDAMYLYQQPDGLYVRGFEIAVKLPESYLSDLCSDSTRNRYTPMPPDLGKERSFRVPTRDVALLYHTHFKQVARPNRFLFPTFYQPSQVARLVSLSSEQLLHAFGSQWVARLASNPDRPDWVSMVSLDERRLFERYDRLMNILLEQVKGYHLTGGSGLTEALSQLVRRSI